MPFLSQLSRPATNMMLAALMLALILPAACSRKKQITGKEFIPREELVDILLEIHLIDGITNDRKFYRRYEGVDSIDLVGPILEKRGVTPWMLDTTLTEYTRYPELFDEVYNDVIMKLNIMMDENDNTVEEKPG
jgi:hypothetical protein